MIDTRHNTDSTVTRDERFAASKAVGQLAFVERSYGLCVLQRNRSLKHDLAVMLHHRDLDHVALDLIGRDGKVLFTFTIRFHGEPGRANTVDSAQGVEVPILDRRLISDGRFVVHRRGRDAAYRHQLLGHWSPAPNLQRHASDSFESEHARKITGGRQSGSVQLGRKFRHELVVTAVPSPSYAFARSLNTGLNQDVFCHRKFAGSGRALAVGRRISAVVIQTPRGLQARAIRAT